MDKAKARNKERNKVKSYKTSLYYINPKNVSSAIEMYGYTYSIKNTILVYLAIVAMAYALGLIFALPPLYVAVIAITGIVCAPRIIINSYKSMYEQKRFSDVNIYIEQLLYSFRKKPIIQSALEDAGKALAKDSPMRKVIDEAVNYIKYDLSGEDASAEALRIIEASYKCQRIRDAHNLLLKVKDNAGDYFNSSRIILMNRRNWEIQTCRHQKECKAKQKMVNIALMLICLTTTITPLLFNTTQLSQLRITDYMAYHIGTTVMIVLCIIIYTKTDRIATINWLENESELTDEEQVALYNKVENYDFKKERRKSYIWSSIPFVLGICFFLLKWNIAAVVMIPVFILMLEQHKISYSMAKKRLIREITKAFPQWLMQMSLLIQTTQNIHAAINKSIADAPAVLVPALEELQRELELDPQSNEPYCNFLRNYNYMDISSAMGMLYSLSNGGGGDADSQIEEILEKNVVMLEQMEDMLNEKRLTAIQAQFMMPALVGGFKLLIDMTILLIAFPSMNFF